MVLVAGADPGIADPDAVVEGGRDAHHPIVPDSVPEPPRRRVVTGLVSGTGLTARVGLRPSRKRPLSGGRIGLVSHSRRAYAARMMQPRRPRHRGLMAGPRGGRRGLAVPRGQRGPTAQRRRRQIDARATARDMQLIRPRPVRSRQVNSRPRAGRSRARGMQAGCLRFILLPGLALVLVRLILGRKSGWLAGGLGGNPGRGALPGTLCEPDPRATLAA